MISAAEDDESDDGAGVVYVFLGPLLSSGSVSDADAVLRGVGENDGAYLIRGPGDIDGDGFSDILIGAQGGSAEESRAAYLVRGPVTGTHSLEDADMVFSETEELGAGGELDRLGDVDGDGADDVASGHRSRGERSTGAVYLFFSDLAR